MSADNGVYIAEFVNTQSGNSHFRVLHTQCIDNIDYVWKEDGEEAGKQEVREFYQDAPQFAHEKDAREHAWEVYEELTICEYGICSLGTFEDIF